jgi:hypothetical protein
LFFLFLVGVRIRPVAVIVPPVTDVVTYAMRLPVAAAESSGGRVAVALIRTVPGATAAPAGAPAKNRMAVHSRATWNAAAIAWKRAAFIYQSFSGRRFSGRAQPGRNSGIVETGGAGDPRIRRSGRRSGAGR